MRVSTVSLVLAAALTVLPVSDAHALTSLATCRLDLAKANAAWFKGNQKELLACIASPPADGCRFNILAPTKLLSQAVAAGSACDTAVQSDGATIEEVLAGECPASWWNCDRWGPATALSDVYTCHRCRQTGLRIKVGYDVSRLPTADDSPEERQCAAGLFKAMARASQSAVRDTVACARSSGEPPWACPVSAADDSKFGRRLARLPQAAAACQGSLDVGSSAVRRLCNQAIVTADDLASCFRRIALCQACLEANQALGASQDCAAFSGDWQCDASFDEDYGLPAAGGFLVTNRADDSMTIFQAGAQYAFGTLEASTFPVGDQPVDVAYGNETGAAFVANNGDSTVSALNVRTGAPLHGSLTESTTAVGTNPTAVAIHTPLALVYAASGADGSVTILDMFDGSYAFGDLAASTVAAGGSPSALAVDEDSDILYVADAAGDSVVFLNAADATPYFGTLAASTFPVGTEPRALRLVDSLAGRELLVTNHGDGTVTRLVAATGSPALGTLAASTIAAGNGAIASVALDANVWTEVTQVYTAMKEGDSLSAVAAPEHETVGGMVGSASMPAGGNPSDLELYSTQGPYRDALMVPLASADAIGIAPIRTDYSLLGMSPAEGAMIPFPYDLESLDVIPSSGEIVVGTGGFTPAMMFVDPATRTTRQGTVGAAPLAYSEARNVLYAPVGSDPLSIVMLDGTTGDFLNGTLENSSFDAGCPGSWLFDVAVSDATDTLFVACPFTVVYHDLATGAPKTGELATSTLEIGEYPRGLTVDDVNGRVYSIIDTGGTGTGILVLDTSPPGFAFGTLAASTVLEDSLAWSQNTRIAIAPGLNLLYRSMDSGSELRLYDLDDFDLRSTLVLSSDPYQNVVGMTVDVARDRLWVSRMNVYRASTPNRMADVLYLHASDGSFVGGSEDSASLPVEIDDYNYLYGYPVTYLSGATNTLVARLSGFDNDALGSGTALLLLDPLQPQVLGTGATYQNMVATGGEPSSVALITAAPY